MKYGKASVGRLMAVAALATFCAFVPARADEIAGVVDPDYEMSYSGGIVSSSGYTTLFTNRNLADYDVKSTDFKCVNGGAGYDLLIGPQGLGSPECCIRGVTANGAERLRVLMQRYQSPNLFSVELELVQQGDDIAGKVLSCRYVSGSINLMGLDIQKLYLNGAVKKRGTDLVTVQDAANIDANRQGYGINQLTMVRRIPAHTVTIDGDDLIPSTNIAVAAGTCLRLLNSSQTIGRLSGGGRVVVDADGPVESVYGDYLGPSECVIATNRLLSERLALSASMRVLRAGIYSTSPGKIVTAKAYKIETVPNDANGWYRCQFQCLINSQICCVRVKLRQSGADIVAKTDYAYYVAASEGSDPSCGLGHDFYRSSATAMSVVQNGTGWGASLNDISFTFRNEVIAGAANTMTNAATMFVCGSPATATTNTLRVTDLGGLPTNGTVTVGPYGILNLDATGAQVHGYGISSSTATIVVQTNGQLTLSRQSMFAPSLAQRVRLYGGAVNYGGTRLRKEEDNLLYANNLMLADGARMYGARPRIGFQTTVPVWIVTGSAPSVCDSGVIFMDFLSGTQDTVFRLYVEDVTSDEGADLIWNGPLSLLDGSTTYDDISVRKLGEGTVLQNGVSTLKEPTEIWRGTWVFGASGISENAQEFKLEGDTTLALAAGVSNGLGKVTVNAPATLKFGEGSLLTLNSIEVAENSTLTIDGEFADTTLRVAERVSSAQLARINFDGGRVEQDANGYIMRRKPKGFRILVR